ncbi:hypothetical protein E1A91_D11G030300v1 [Gossypium mustelinum]|uniref:Uncharacterized protein n=4 Tax=Gossypium TaxID=3633 RepID=A0A5J5P5N7_GOSBA|nr:hypothetical protein ES319_D11G030500v1 [Gossypium barbadense]TYG43618.1 hypothetical protein ES288_D11G031900v1 [Gossypium darwinii]TYH41978.1 hypothetical protein ES332_D11G031300v1 [Gossypium tomentosum]TYI53795.1 hypothetical protein E1A91_D11G030300v1 [Gossypium mustelinum]
MDCLVLPISLLRKCGTASQLGYRRLPEDRRDELDQKVTVVVGKEKNEFLIDPFMLEESPFRVLIDVVKEEYGSEVIMDAKGEKKRVNLVELDVILFEHMLLVDEQ